MAKYANKHEENIKEECYCDMTFMNITKGHANDIHKCFGRS